MKHQFTHRVIYQDTDAEGVVYYANYLGFFERGRTELLRQRGASLKEIKSKEGIVFAITNFNCDYKSPALYDDELQITTEICEISAVRIVFKQEVYRGKQLLVSAKVTACAIDLKNFRPVRIPEEIVGLIA
ncbi:MAG: tol-pal system-associated acyl-CoA thioesterase [Candidatus Saganbacteria bacterium]|nr:tol-pal system-associated acyl-CoA thioesterase [Candidatus Saganbacteria bacterium]